VPIIRVVLGKKVFESIQGTLEASSAEGIMM
jgi:hypothetical protein